MRINGIKETCLYITDIEKTKKFYNVILGLPIISMVEGRHIFFQIGKAVLLCFLPEVTQNEEVLPPHYANGPQHIAFEVPKDEYLKWKEMLQKYGVVITYEQIWDRGYESFYFNDPSGNVLEMVQPGMWD